jgi:hypothetical protein
MVEQCVTEVNEMNEVSSDCFHYGFDFARSNYSEVVFSFKFPHYRYLSLLLLSINHFQFTINQ